MVHFIPSSQRRLALMAAQADTAPALICGGSGTGKGAIAKWMHANGPRAAKPLIAAVQTSPLSAQILSAQGGTILVAEIGEWPRSEQNVLLSLLKSRSIPQAGGTPMLLNVRVIATTSQGLEGRAQGGLFNIELLEKLNVFRIEMPPLSKRGIEFEDIALGVSAEIKRELQKDHLRGFSTDAWERLKTYEWPGNIRELRNVLRLAVIAAKGDRIESTDLPEFDDAGPARIDFRATREQFERIYILELLRTFNWDLDKTCEMTRMDRSVLQDKMKKYGIRRETH